MCLFAHTDGASSTENGWELVLPSFNNTKLVVSSTGNQNAADVPAELSVKHHDYRENVLEVFWKPGYSAAESNCMEGFDNKFKWKADYTKNWFYGWLLPKASEFALPAWKRSGKRTLAGFLKSVWFKQISGRQ